MLLEVERIIGINKETARELTWNSLWAVTYSILFVVLTLYWWGYIPEPSLPPPQL
jgi:hypothetical protein